MEEERINLSQRERDRLRVLHELEQGHLQQREAARRLRLSARQIRRLEARLAQEGDRGLVHRLRGWRSNCKIPEDLQQRALRQLRRPCYAGFGPTLAAEHLARNGVVHAATAGVLCGVATARLTHPFPQRLSAQPSARLC